MLTLILHLHLHLALKYGHLSWNSTAKIIYSFLIAPTQLSDVLLNYRTHYVQSTRGNNSTLLTTKSINGEDIELFQFISLPLTTYFTKIHFLIIFISLSFLLFSVSFSQILYSFLLSPSPVIKNLVTAPEHENVHFQESDIKKKNALPTCFIKCVCHMVCTFDY